MSNTPSHIRKSFLLLFLGCASLSFGQNTPTPTPTPAWSLPSIDYFIKNLPGPPRPGSFRDRMDVRDAIAKQAIMNSKQERHVQITYLFNVFEFSRVFGPDFNARNYPLTAAFFIKLANTANVVISELKNHYKRPRPFVAHPEQIKLMVPNEPGYSYPSGHTTRSRLFAFVVAELDPASRAQVFNAAEHVALDRILGGEHYLTDLEGGRRLGKLLFELLNQNPQFVVELQAVQRAEWSPPPEAKPPKPSPSPSVKPQ